MKFSQKSLIAALIAASLLTACDKGAGPSDKVVAAPAVPAAASAPAAPAVAKVNDKEITLAQVNAVLARLGTLSPEQSQLAGKQVLDKLVDQEVVAQAAVAQKLDQDPKVVQLLELTRREILANVYLEQIAGKTAKPTDEEIKTFFDKNPAMFSERKVYILRELSVNAKPEFAAELQAQVDKQKSLEGVAAWLKTKNISFTPNVAAKPAEQIPAELLPKIAALKDGEITTLNNPNGFLLEQKMSSKPQPVTLEQAKTVIERMLTNQKRNEAAAGELKTLHQKAKIEFLGDFAKAAPATAPAAAPAAVPAATAPAETPKADAAKK